MRNLLVLLLVVPALSLSACGGSTTDTPALTDSGTSADAGGDASVGDGDASSGDGGSEAASETASDAPSEDADTAEAKVVCSTLSTRALCLNCCGTEDPAGEKEFLTAVIACACAPGVCKTECDTTACASPAKKADATCSACLQASIKPAGDGGTAGACVGPVTSACTGACKKYLGCLVSCPKA